MANWSEMKRFFNAVLNVFVTIFQRNFQGKDIDSEKIRVPVLVTIWVINLKPTFTFEKDVAWQHDVCT